MPAIWDYLRTVLGLQGDPYYLLKPVDNQTFYLQLAVVVAGITQLVNVKLVAVEMVLLWEMRQLVE